MRWGQQFRFFRDEVMAAMQRVDDSDELEEVWAAGTAFSTRPGGVSRKLPLPTNPRPAPPSAGHYSVDHCLWHQNRSK